MLRKIMLSLAVLAMAQATGCGGRTITPYDPGVDDGGISDAPPWKPDKGKKDSKPVKPDTGGPLKPNCAGCRDYVFSQILVPITSYDAQKYALVFKGKKYNALGNILALLSQQAPGMNVSDSVSNSINKGKAIVLMRLQANSLVNDSTVKAQLWLGADKKCCSATYSPTQCAKQAAASCFNGKGTFKVHSASPKDMLFLGSINNGQLRLGPGKMMLKMSMAKKTANIPLKHVRLSGAVSNMMINAGVLSGAIPKKDLEKTVIPQIALMLNETYTSPNVDKTTKDMIKQLFDMNTDGHIAPDEVANNALIKTFLAGDVDVDSDGENELSLGLGYSAVRAKISN